MPKLPLKLGPPESIDRPLVGEQLATTHATPKAQNGMREREKNARTNPISRRSPTIGVQRITDPRGRTRRLMLSRASLPQKGPEPLGARSGSLTFTRFLTQGSLPKDLRKRFLEAARLRVFEPLKPDDEALEAIGWCAMERPFDLELDAGKMFHDSYILLGFRVDRYRIPGALLRSHIADEERRLLERTKKQKLSRNEKVEIKDRVVMRLRKKVLPTSKALDVVWHLDEGVVLFFGHSKRTLGDFAALFEKTFGMALLEDSPYAAATRAQLSREHERALKAVEPLSFSSGRKRLGKPAAKADAPEREEPTSVEATESDDLLERVESTRFLGAEFLLWLWLRAELVNQLFSLGELGSFDVWLDNHLTLQSDIDPNERVTVRGAQPSGGAEAREAVRAQKFPVRARLALRNDERDFACVLVAHRFAVASGVIPAVLTKDTDDAFVERMALVEHLNQSLDQLFAAFLADRLSELWRRSWEPAIVSWADGDAVPHEILSTLARGKGAPRKKAKAR